MRDPVHMGEAQVEDTIGEVRPTFVVNTGRCGSTALSRVLNGHPDVLSINELLSSLGVEAIPEEALSGEEFWQLLASPRPALDAMIRGGAELPEMIYPRSSGRFSVETTGIPALSLMVLPHLSEDPDGLFDELAEVVPNWPPRPAAAQYEALFAWLSRRFGRRTVVERSGYSLHRIPLLREHFPRAGFIHLYRDGPDCALSMSRHVGFRMILLRDRMLEWLGLDSLDEVTPEAFDALPPELAGILPDRFDLAVVQQPLPLEAFGALWSRTIVDGLADLAAVPESARMVLCYEELLDSPDTELTRLAAFLGVAPTEQWLRSARAFLDPKRRGATSELSTEQRARLRDSCAPGTQALAEFSATGASV